MARGAGDIDRLRARASSMAVVVSSEIEVKTTLGSAADSSMLVG